MIGRTVSHYQIVALLGSGGMGVVYRAHDIKLGRPVALKFLSAQRAGEHEAALRFELEARAASALNHPGICTIYEIGESDGDLFIAMELLEGETMHDRLQRGALDLPDVLDYGDQLLDALATAHRRGILHRDLKPANVFLVAGRRAKILDFGLAKIEDAGPTELTVLQPVTQAGAVAGTVAYMSPEQSLGQPVDARSDLFSLGLVLYEMATGRPGFPGPAAAAFDGILNRTPPAPSTVNGSVPPAFDHVVGRALQKRPEARYQSAADFAADLKRVKTPPPATADGEVMPLPSSPSVAPGRPARTYRLASGLVVGLVAALVAAYFTWGRPQSEPNRPFLADATFTQITDRPGVETSAKLTPDGTALVYAARDNGDWDIHWRRIDDNAVVNLTSGSAADDVDPAISPDGQRIAFRSERDGGGIYVMDAAGGNLRQLSNFCHEPAWSPDQASIVCATERITVMTTRLGISPLWILDVMTGGKRQLTTFDGVQPAWSPTGDRIAYWAYGPTRIWSIPAAGGTPVAVTTGADRVWNPVWSPDGRYLFYASNRGGTVSNLWRVPVDPVSGVALGPSEPVTTPSSNAGLTSFSRDGSRVSYVDQSFTRNFTKRRLDRPTEPPTPVTRGAHVYRQLDLSPDGQRLVFTSDSKIFVMAVDGSGLRQLTEGGASRGPRWSPDGTRIAFYSTLVRNREPQPQGANQIWIMNADGSSAEPATSFANTKGVYYPVWSPDGRRISSTSLEGQTLTADLTVPLEQRVPQVLPPLPSPGMSFVAWLWSEDGTQLAGWKLMADGQSAGVAIYDARTASYRDITKAGIYPTWVRDGRALLIVAREQLQLVDLRSLQVTPVPTPERFASDFALAKDEVTIYYAEEQREGDVWLITWPESPLARPR